MTAITFNLLDGRRQHLGTQVLAQSGDHMLADVVGADVGGNAAEQGHHAQANEGQDDAVAHAVVIVQALVDGGEQGRDGQAADDAQDDRRKHHQAIGLEQAQEFAGGATRCCGHETTSFATGWEPRAGRAGPQSGR
ncbi:hypothetical protein D3C81_529510 [compost metagenome]